MSVLFRVRFDLILERVELVTENSRDKRIQ